MAPAGVSALSLFKLIQIFSKHNCGFLCVYLLQTLYTYCENFRALKVLIAASYSGANVEVDPKFVFGETNRSDAFLKKFPLGKVFTIKIIALG